MQMKNFFLLYYQLKLNPLRPMPRFDMQGANGFVGNMRLDIHHQPPFCIVTIAGELEECGTVQDVSKFLDVFLGDNEVLFGKVVFIDPESGGPIVVHTDPGKRRTAPKPSKATGVEDLKQQATLH